MQNKFGVKGTACHKLPLIGGYGVPIQPSADSEGKLGVRKSQRRKKLVKVPYVPVAGRSVRLKNQNVDQFGLNNVGLSQVHTMPPKVPVYILIPSYRKSVNTLKKFLGICIPATRPEHFFQCFLTAMRSPLQTSLRNLQVEPATATIFSFFSLFYNEKTS